MSFRSTVRRAGFTNAGDALGMSPALVDKFLDAGKEVARHLVLLPDGIRFSKYTTERDRADEIMVRIHQFYSRYVNVNRQLGDTWDDPATAKANVIRRNGSIPLEAYFAAALAGWGAWRGKKRGRSRRRARVERKIFRGALEHAQSGRRPRRLVGAQPRSGAVARSPARGGQAAGRDDPPVAAGAVAV